MKNENVAVLDKLDNYLRKEDSFLARSLNYISPLTGDDYRRSKTKYVVENLIVVPSALLSLPLIGVIALLVKSEDGGPIFYKQKRLLDENNDFYLYKFRSMHVNAENEVDLTQQTFSLTEKHRDSRCTKTGRFLRKYDFDELPQLWQIIIGRMSLIGFRALPEHETCSIEKQRPISYEKWMNGYAEGKPAILNLLSVAGHLHTYSPKDRVHYDLLYARKASLGLDLYILWRHLLNVLHLR